MYNKEPYSEKNLARREDRLPAPLVRAAFSSYEKPSCQAPHPGGTGSGVDFRVV